MLHSTRATNVPSGVPFCKSFELVLHPRVPFHKPFESVSHKSQLNQFECVYLWPVITQMLKVGARVATGGEVLARGSPSDSKDEVGLET